MGKRRRVKLFASMTLSLQLGVAALGTAGLCLAALAVDDSPAMQCPMHRNDHPEAHHIGCRCPFHSLLLLLTGNAVFPDVVTVHVQVPAVFAAATATIVIDNLRTPPLSPPPRLLAL